MTDFPGLELDPVPSDAPPAAAPAEFPGLELDPTPEERDADTDNRLGALLKVNFGANADKHASVLELSRKTGIEPKYVEGNFDSVQKSWNASQFDVRKWRLDNPVKAQMLLTNPELGQTVQEDKHLDLLQKTVSTVWAGLKFLGESQAHGEALRMARGTGAAPVVEAPKVPTAEEVYPVQHDVTSVVDPSASGEGTLAQTGALAGAATESLLGLPKSPMLTEAFTAAGKSIGATAERVLAAWGHGQRQIEQSKLGADLMFMQLLATRQWNAGEDSSALDASVWDMEKRLVEGEKGLLPRKYGGNALDDILTNIAEVAPSQAEGMKGGGAGFVVGGALGAAAGALTRNPGAVASFARIGAGMGAKVGAFAASARLETGGAWLEYRRTRTDDGELVPSQVAMGAAIYYGLAAATVEVASMAPLVRRLPGPLGEAFAQKEGRQALAALMKNKGSWSLFTRVAKDWGEAAGAEGGEEFVQNIMQDVAGYAAKVHTAGKLQKADVQGSLTSGVAAFEVGALAAGGTSLGMSFAEFAQESHLDAQQERAHEQIKAILGAAESPTMRAAPVAVAKAIAMETALAGEAVKAVYIDPGQLQQRLYQGGAQGGDAAAVELLGPDGATRLKEAIATGQKLEVPMDQYLEHWTPKPIAKEMADHTASRPGMLTPAEFQAREEQSDAEAEQLAKEMAAQHVPEKGASAKGVADALVKQLAGTQVSEGGEQKTLGKRDARFMAKVVQKGLETFAAKTGIPVEQLAQQFQHRVEQQQAAAEDTSFGFGANEAPAPDTTAQQDAAPAVAPSPALRAKAEALVANMRSPERKAMGESWLAWTKDPSGPRPKITDAFEREMAEFGVVDPVNGYGFGEDGRSMEGRGTPGSRKGRASGEQPAELRRHRIEKNMTQAQWLAAGYKTFYQSPKDPLAPADKAIAEHEDRIRSESNEHAVALAADGTVLFEHTQNIADQISFTQEQADILRANGDATLTHNHPRGTSLSADDLLVAIFANLKEMRAVGPDGAVWRVRRPGASWGYAYDVQQWRQARDALQGAQRASGVYANRRMSEVIVAAGGNPEDGADAKGFDKDTWHRISAEESTRAFNAFAKAKGFGWRIERLAPVAVGGLGREDNARLPSAGFRVDGRTAEDLRAGNQEALAAVLDELTRELKSGKSVEQALERVRAGMRDAAEGAQETLDFLSAESEEHRRSDKEASRIADAEQALGEAWAKLDAAEALTVDRVSLPDILHQVDDEEAPRGWVERYRKGVENLFKIVLTDKADRSTFLHETGHTFLFMLGSIAAEAGATPETKEMLASALKWLGADSYEGLTEEQHEKWARGWEAYLMEGKAPSLALEKAFEAFKDWLLHIYKQVRALNVEIDDSIRDVFDRLLATDEEIAKAKAKRGEPMWASAEAAARDGVPLEAYQEYLADQVKATSKTQRWAELRILKDHLRTKEKAWVEQEAALVEAAGKEYDARKDVRAKAHLAAEPQDMEGTGGDDVAAQLGYPTKAALLEAVAAVPGREAWAKGEAKARMLEQHGDLLQDRARLQTLIQDHFHQGDLQTLLSELEALRSKANGGSRKVETARRAAKLMVDRMQVGTLNASRALAAERSAAHNALVAAAKGAYPQAYAYKLQQVVNAFAYKELTQAREEREATLELAKALTKDKARARLGLASPVYRDGSDTILEALGLKEEERREKPPASLQQLLDTMDANAHSATFDTGVIEKVLAQHQEWRALIGRVAVVNEDAIKELTVSEMRQVAGALKSIQKAAAALTESIVDGKREDKALVKAELLAEMAKHLPSRGDVSSSVGAEGLLEKAGGLFNALDGTLRSPAAMLGSIGGQSIDSMAYRAFVEPLQVAKRREADLLKTTVKPVVAAFDAIPKEVRARLWEKVDGKKLFPGHKANGARGIAAPTRRFELLMMFLNAGNESSLQRLTEGRNITPAQLRTAFDTLTKAELDWAQAVLDSFDSLRPESFALEERDTGLAPERVMPLPIETKHGTYPGGYFPAVYDRRVDTTGERQASKTLADLFDPTYTRPGTSHNHLKARAVDFSGVIALDPSIIQAHVAQVAHDIAFREVIKSVGGLLLDKEIQGALKEYLGDAKAQQLLQYLKDVGQMRGAAVSTHESAPMRIYNAMRGNAVVALLGYKLPVALGDLSNIPVAAVKHVDAQHLAAGLAEFMRSPFESRKAALAASGELRFRDDQLTRDFAKKVKRITATGPLSRGPLANLNDHAFAFMEATDKLTATPVWMGAHRQAIAAGRSEADAVRFADDVMVRVFPSHSVVDKAALLRSKGWLGAATLFYGYFSVIYNVQRDIVEPGLVAMGFGKKALAAKEFAKASGQLMALWLISGAMAELLSGRGKEPDEDWAQWLIRKTLITPVQSLPFGMAGTIESLALHKKPSVRAAPGVAFLDSIGQLAHEAANGNADSEKLLMETAKTMGLTFGVATGPLPAIKYVADVAQGDADPRRAVSGLIYGNRDNQPANPASLLEDAVLGEP